MSSLFGIGGGGNVGAAGGGIYGHTIDKSLRFEESGSANLTFTPSNSGTDNKKFTYSVWIKRGQESADAQHLIQSKNTGSGTGQGHVGLFLDTSNSLDVYTENGGANPEGTRLLRDHSAWYHICFVYDTTQATDTERVKVYINGDRDTASTSTFPALNSVNASMNYTGQEQYIGKYVSGFTRYFNGYMAEIHMVDGQALDPTSFGETKDGVWVPKEYPNNGTTSHGVNGYHLTFQGTGTATTSQGTTAQTNIGDDQSGNGNNWTANNLAATDVVLDSPSGNNFATLNPLAEDDVNIKSGAVLSEGNLVTATAGFGSGSAWGGGQSTLAIPTDKKIYCEVLCSNQEGNYWAAGVSIPELSANNTGVSNTGQIAAYNRSAMINGVETDYGSSAGLGGLGVSKLAVDDILQIAVDGATGKVWFGRNGTYFKSPSTNNSGTTGDPAAGSNEIGTVTNPDGKPLFIVIMGGSATVHVNFGQDSSFAGQKTSGSAEAQDANSVGDFYYAPPTDYLCLAASSLSDPAIGPGQSSQADDYFDSTLYTGNGGTQSFVNAGSFQPDFVWQKNRSSAANHILLDSVRGGSKYLISNLTSADLNAPNYMTFNSDGATFSSTDIATNQSGQSYVAWNWKAGGSASSNSNGSITSSVSANPDAGFAVGTYTGNATAGATIGHSLGAIPEMVWVKRRTNARDWAVYHKDLSATPTNAYTLLNSTAGVGIGNTAWNNGTFTSNVFTIGSHELVNANTDSYVFYAFKGIENYSRVGSYVGNGSADGTFVFTNFAVKWLLLKVTAVNNWFIYDSKREGYNQENNTLSPNDNSVEDNSYKLDLLSNGFKIRGSNNAHNQSGQTFIYLAIGDSFKYANAR